jgi:hypothetical protein
MLKTLTRKQPVERSRKKFLRNFPRGYMGNKYIAWERDYKWQAHKSWKEQLDKPLYEALLKARKYEEIATIAIRIESRTNLLFSFEKMALRDAVKTTEGAKNFAEGLYEYVYGKESLKERFENWAEALRKLPVVKTRVHTWPLQTVFGFIANPKEHIFLKPRVTQAAAKAFGFQFEYASKPNWKTYKSILDFAAAVKKETIDLKPRDYIDLQSFIWVMGSEEYE